MKHLKNKQKFYNQKIFDLYGKVIKGDKEAKKEFIEIYKNKFRNNSFLYNEPNAEFLHIMYLHLTK